MPTAQRIPSAPRWPDTNERARLDLDQASLRPGSTMSGVVHLVGDDPRETLSCRLSCVQLVNEHETDVGMRVKVLWEGAPEFEVGAGGSELRFRVEIPSSSPVRDSSRGDRVVWVLDVMDAVKRKRMSADVEYVVPPRVRRPWIVAQFRLSIAGDGDARLSRPASLQELADYFQRGKPKGTRVTVAQSATEVAVSIWEPGILAGAIVLGYLSLCVLIPVYEEGIRVQTIAFAAVWIGFLLPIAAGALFERVHAVFTDGGVRLERRVLRTRRLEVSYGDVTEIDYKVTERNALRAYVSRRSAPGERFLLMRNQSEGLIRWFLIGIKKAAGLPEHFGQQD